MGGLRYEVHKMPPGMRDKVWCSAQRIKMYMLAGGKHSAK